MSRLVEVELCTECPHFDCHHPEWYEWCAILNRRIPLVEGSSPFITRYTIPEDCPLPKKEASL